MPLGPSALAGCGAGLGGVNHQVKQLQRTLKRILDLCVKLSVTLWFSLC